ncbi:hypothetical protein GQ44DRAFT_712203 [Phaeosphaeriaceae sp. PMI808]|nr:hypothetical protein GQ44DRAFT_712203 [Phaeosphaeriaceae sp. PMI808]
MMVKSKESLCSCCASINFGNNTWFALSQLSTITASAKGGCPGCEFFVKIIGQSIDRYIDQEVHIFLQRRRANRSRVYLMIADEKLRVIQVEGLRICNSYGVEPTISAEYNEEDEEFGRVVAAHAADTHCLDLAKEWFHRCASSHGSIFMTTQDTFEDHVSGFSMSTLPKLLQEAVKLVRNFGLRWIWIDAICIVQGNSKDWSGESALMADVYGNATFTICTDHASSTDEGLLIPRDLPVSPCFGPNDLDTFCFQRISNDWEGMCGQALYRRGWAFQERILAPRTIHFLNDQIAWECNTTLYQEGFHGRMPSPTGHFSKPHFGPYFHQRRFLENAPTTGHGDDMDLHERLQRWNGVAQEISVRSFTVDSDTLPAISGLASAIQVPGLGKYFAGVWEYNPFLSMYWHVRYPQAVWNTHYRAPSWSWAWTYHQLMWRPHVLRLDITVELVDAWRAWDLKWGPRLLEHHMILKTADPKGEVLEGSYLVMTGFCRYVRIVPDCDIQYDPWYWADDEVHEKGVYAFMDQWVDSTGFVSSFTANGHEVYPGAEPTSDMCYLCVQVAQEKRLAIGVPKTLALVLENVEGSEAFRRVGLLAFDFEEADHGGWTRRELKLV